MRKRAFKPCPESGLGSSTRAVSRDLRFKDRGCVASKYTKSMNAYDL